MDLNATTGLETKPKLGTTTTACTWQMRTTPVSRKGKIGSSGKGQKFAQIMQIRFTLMKMGLAQGSRCRIKDHRGDVEPLKRLICSTVNSSTRNARASVDGEGITSESTRSISEAELRQPIVTLEIRLHTRSMGEKPPYRQIREVPRFERFPIMSDCS